MKLIHCADIHLDSPMTSQHIPSEITKQRKEEIRHSFEKMVEYASEQNFDGIIIAGDLLDSSHFMTKTKKSLADLIQHYQNLNFYILPGNHDKRLAELFPTLPNNLILFPEQLSSFVIGENVVLTGGTAPDFSTLRLDSKQCNIVVYHGEIIAGNESVGFEKTASGQLKNKYIDYIAMGHYHSYREMKIDERCTAVYSGALEGRGFDETEEKGFVEITIESKTVSYQFHPFSKRKLHRVSLDMTGVTSEYDLEQKAKQITSAFSDSDMVEIVLQGSKSEDLHFQSKTLADSLSDAFYFVKVKDESKIDISGKNYETDLSIIGECYRLIQKEAVSDAEKSELFQMIKNACDGEEILL